ncbi:response regulator [Pelagibacterium lacus]|nr:response regulator [Pelagibacterium lacus]
MTQTAARSETNDITGKCVLVVEDDYVLAREVCNDLRRHGANVLGPAPTVHYANLIMGKRKLDGAILDIKLFGEEVYELVDVLMARGVPIVFATAYQPDQIDARYRRFDVMTKPLDYTTLRRKVANFRPQPPTKQVVDAPAFPHAAPVAYGTGTGAITDRERWARMMLAAMRLRK